MPELDLIIIAEKPSVGRELAAAILTGSKKTAAGFIVGRDAGGLAVGVSWVRGHLVGLSYFEDYDPAMSAWSFDSLPFAPSDWKFKEHALKSGGAGKLLKDLKGFLKHLKATGEVVNCCDAGREGELIFRKAITHLRATTKSTTYSRMWCRSNTTKALTEAYGKRFPLAEKKGLAQAAYTRDQADWLLGLNMTRMATICLGGEHKGAKLGTLSVGRVQTPTLALIVDREEAINKFTPADFWEVYGEFPSGRGKADLTAFYEASNKTAVMGSPPKGTEDAKVIWDEALATKFVDYCKRVTPYKVEDKTSMKNQYAPLPFDLPTAQKRFAESRGWSASKTLEILQELYEKKLLTYPRTDFRYFPEDLKDQVYANIKGLWAKLAALGCKRLGVLPMPAKTVSDAAKCFNDKKIGDHFALSPTDDMSALSSLGGSAHDKDLMHAFMAVVQAAVIAIDAPAEISAMERTWVSDAKPVFVFKAKAEDCVSAGWKRWLPKPPTSKVLPPKVSGTEHPTEVELSKGTTSKPKRYNTATILSAMENAARNMGDISLAADPTTYDDAKDAMKDKGLGTAATRASILDNLAKKKYIKTVKRDLVPEEKGIYLIHQLKDRMPLITIPLSTAEMEHKLVLMENDDPKAPSRLEFLEDLLAELKRVKTTMPTGGIRRMRTAATDTGVPCPVTGKNITDNGTFFKAACLPKVALWKEMAGKSFRVSDYKDILYALHSGKPAPCFGFKSKAGAPFNACLVVKKDKLELDFGKH